MAAGQCFAPAPFLFGMSACEKFVPQAFRKKMCASCFLAEDAHGAAPGLSVCADLRAAGHEIQFSGEACMRGRGK